MGAMRMSDEHLSDTIQICRWTIENTGENHTQHIRAKKLINRIHKFVIQTDRNKKVYEQIKQDEQRATLFNDE